MTDKQFRRLSRTDLIEIIYELQQGEKTLRQENELLKQQLEQQRTALEQANSLADVLEKLNGLYAAAQASQLPFEAAPDKDGAAVQLLLSQALRTCERADAYMEDMKRRAAKLGSIALLERDELLARTEEECRRLRELCEEQTRQSREQADAYMEAVMSKTAKPDCDNIPAAEAEDGNGSICSVQEV